MPLAEIEKSPASLVGASISKEILKKLAWHHAIYVI
jgi:hypothetical protein